MVGCLLIDGGLEYHAAIAHRRAKGGHAQGRRSVSGVRVTTSAATRACDYAPQAAKTLKPKGFTWRPGRRNACSADQAANFLGIYEMSAVTIEPASARATAPTEPIGSSSAELGSHCTSSGRSVPSG